MKLLLVVTLLLLVISINNAEFSDKSLNECTIDNWIDMSCLDFKYNYLPFSEEFVNASFLNMFGTFSELAIDPNYAYLQSIKIYSDNLQKFEFNSYSSFDTVEDIGILYSEQAVHVDFTGAEKMTGLKYVDIAGNKLFTYSCESLKSSNLKKLIVTRSNLKYFDFSCVPNTMEDLSLEYMKISSFNLPANQKINPSSNVVNKSIYITDSSYCSHLKNLTSLTKVELAFNHLQEFRFECLPSSIRNVNLYGNNITNLTDLSYLPHSHGVHLTILENPIHCTCSLLRDYVQLLDDGNVSFGSHNGRILTCANNDSKLAQYPWTQNARAIRLHDASALACLTVGESTVNEINAENVNNNIDESPNNINNDTGTGDNGNDIETWGEDSNGDSGSFNLIDVSLVITFHIIQLYFVLL